MRAGYVPSSRELFRRRHKLPSTCETCNCEDHCLGCVCWGCALRQMEAQADHMKQQALSYAASRTSTSLRSVTTDMER